MTMQLIWHFGPEQALVSVPGDSPIAEWSSLSLRTAADRPANAGVILRLVEDGSGEELGPGTVGVQYEALADLTPGEADGIGLPPRLDWPLVVMLPGIPAKPESEATWRFQGRNGRPLHPTDVRGCICTVDGALRRLSREAFRTVQALEAFNASRDQGAVARTQAWGRVAERMPEDTVAEGFLKELRVAYTECFSLRPFLNTAGEADFDPIPGVWEEGGVFEEEGPRFAQRLPEAPTERFQNFFRRGQAKPNYALGGGWYTVLDPKIMPVLEVVREIQEGSAQERLAFLRNPEAILQEQLPELDPGELSQLFASEDYSERVQGTGIWKPPVLPWVKKEGESWLPDERLGIRIGDEYVHVVPDELDTLIKETEKAIEAGQPLVEYRGHAIPATKETLEALRHLTAIVKPPPGGGGSTPQPRVILEVAENFTVVTYSPDDPTRRRPGDPTVSLADLGVRSTPLPHQEVAIEWLKLHWVEGSTGALLADDMGLGKTFQTLVFMRWLRHQMSVGRVAQRPLLVVAPTGLLENWVQEQERHLEGERLGALVRCYGAGLRDLRASAGRELGSGIPVLDVQRMRSADWILTTYETLRDYQHSFGRIHFAFAALDEVQKAKNPASGISQAVKTIHAEMLVCVTGTPVENRLAELWNILDIAQPGRLGTLKEFSSSFESGEGLEEEQRVALKLHLSDPPPPTMLRRMKDDHLTGLPAKEVEELPVEMPEAQCWAYDRVLGAAQFSQDGGGGESMLALLGQLRSVSLHPFVRTEETDEEYINASARLRATFEILDKVKAAGDKALVFLESREMQGILVELLQRRYGMKRPPMIINGAVEGPKRQERVNTFQGREGFDILILSPRAGGVGLTLTAANHVIHLTRWWNPAVEDQCTDRVYRIGQERPVRVYLPVAIHPRLKDGSFDQLLHNLLERKRTLSRDALAPTALSRRETEGLFEQVLEPARPPSTLSEDELRDIDSLSPQGFERWVMEKFRGIGYRVDGTPTSGDGGVDCIARPPAGTGRPILFIQCKHTQVAAPCSHEGVIEVNEGRRRYPVDRRAECVVVTNAPGFTARAVELAGANGVHLFQRGRLGQIKMVFG